MRKLIIFLLIFNTMSGQNLVTREIFGSKGKGWNTFIGGVSSTISTSAQLATKLGISNNRIRNFVVVGSDIKCKIIGTYNTSSYFYPDGRNNTTTYYLDNDGLITDVGYVCNYPVLKQFYHPNALLINYGYYGRGCAILNIAYFPKLTSCNKADFYGFMEGKQAGLKCRIYIPLCTTLVTPTTGSVFYIGANPNTTIYCHPSLATNNGGAPDNDIANAISAGATVRYVTNFTPPNPVTSLSTGTITSTSIQFNFTSPTGSTNAYDFSEIYKKDINGNWLYISDIASSGIVSGLTTSTTYDFKIVARDIFYNGAELFITASTL